MSPRVTSRRIVGLYVNPASDKNYSCRFVRLLWQETLSDGTQRVVHGTPRYEHDLHPVLTPLFGVLCEGWRQVVSALKQADAAEGREEGP